MGWTNSHIHSFIDGVNEYAPAEFEVDGAIESDTVRLDEILNEDKSEIGYEYDFGDGWEHNIILEKVLPPDDQLKLPVCIAGQRNCPPEDCGGVRGYSEMLKILKQPDHEEYEEFITWLDGKYDPEYFDKDENNIMLKRRDFGCLWL